MRALRRRARGAQLGPPASAPAALPHRHRGPSGPTIPLRGPASFRSAGGHAGRGRAVPRAAATLTAEHRAAGPSRLPRSRSTESRSRVPGAPRPASAAPGRTGRRARGGGPGGALTLQLVLWNIHRALLRQQVGHGVDAPVHQRRRHRVERHLGGSAPARPPQTLRPGLMGRRWPRGRPERAGRAVRRAVAAARYGAPARDLAPPRPGPPGHAASSLVGLPAGASQGQRGRRRSGLSAPAPTAARCAPSALPRALCAARRPLAGAATRPAAPAPAAAACTLARLLARSARQSPRSRLPRPPLPPPPLPAAGP